MFLRNAYTEPNNSQKFEIVISLPDDVRDNQKVNKALRPFDDMYNPVHLIYGDKNQIRAMAMCASDLGAIQNGDSVLEASVC